MMRHTVLCHVLWYRGTMLVNSWIFLFGGLIMSLAPSVMWLIPARLIIGFASGLSSVVVPVYLGKMLATNIMLPACHADMSNHVT